MGSLQGGLELRTFWPSSGQFIQDVEDVPVVRSDTVPVTSAGIRSDVPIGIQTSEACFRTPSLGMVWDRIAVRAYERHFSTWISSDFVSAVVDQTMMKSAEEN